MGGTVLNGEKVLSRSGSGGGSGGWVGGGALAKKKQFGKINSNKREKGGKGYRR